MNKNNIIGINSTAIVIIAVIIFLFGFVLANAQEDITVTAVSDTPVADAATSGAATDETQARPSVKPTLMREKVDAQKERTKDLVNNAKDKRVEALGGAREKQADIKSDAVEKKNSFNDRLKDKVSDIQNKASEKREGFGTKNAERKEKLDEKRDEIEAKKIERKEKLNEKAKDRIEAYVNRIIKRLNAALDRLEKIAGRVESRIAKLEEKFTDRSIDLSEAKRLLDVTKNEIAIARESVSSVEGAVAGALATDNPKESFSAIHELIKEASANVKSAHKALIDAIKAVKAEVGDQSSASDKPDDGVGDN